MLHPTFFSAILQYVFPFGGFYNLFPHQETGDGEITQGRNAEEKQVGLTSATVSAMVKGAIGVAGKWRKQSSAVTQKGVYGRNLTNKNKEIPVPPRVYSRPRLAAVGGAVPVTS